MSEAAILAETDRWIVVDKPSGWLSIPGRPTGEAEETRGGPVVSDWLAARFGKTWTVHRIDRETTGVLLFARTAEAHREASLWFERHEIRKGYDCLAAGRPSQPVLKFKTPIDGKPSITQVEVKERFEECFLASIRIVTGRTHQIRIHLSQAGHPLLGDRRYGGSPSLPRVALHAAWLELPGGERFEAPWPDDFRGWVEERRKAGAGR